MFKITKIKLTKKTPPPPHPSANLRKMLKENGVLLVAKLMNESEKLSYSNAVSHFVFYDIFILCVVDMSCRKVCDVVFNLWRQICLSSGENLLGKKKTDSIE